MGKGRVTKNVNKISLDEAFRVSDKEALKIVYKLIREEGLILGGSSGINIAGAIKLAKKMGPGNTIVTILCDYGTRYESKIFNKKFLKLKITNTKMAISFDPNEMLIEAASLNRIINNKDVKYLILDGI